MHKINCPYCNIEYLPGEIFIPNYIIGQPKEIERDEDGNIVWSDGIKQNLKETYTCDNCHKKFNIKIDLDYTIEKTDDFDMSEDYVSDKYKDRIYLREE